MQGKLAAFVLRLIGWKTVFTQPPGPKSVVLVYPHTSNWDFVIGALWRAKHQVFINWAGKDTLFRIHGTSEPWSIGKAVSSGCIRLFNQDIIDLYSRVPSGSRVVVLQHQAPADEATPVAAANDSETCWTGSRSTSPCACTAASASRCVRSTHCSGHRTSSTPNSTSAT